MNSKNGSLQQPKHEEKMIFILKTAVGITLVSLAGVRVNVLWGFFKCRKGMNFHVPALTFIIMCCEAMHGSEPRASG